MRKFSLLLLAFLCTKIFATPKNLVIKFSSFTGENCEYIRGEERFYIDRWSTHLGRGEIPWQTLRPSEFSNRRIDLQLSQIPETDDDWQIYFRFYAMHSNTRADQYESDLHITQNLIRQLSEGKVQTLSLTTKPTFEVEPIRDCRLNLELVLL